MNRNLRQAGSHREAPAADPGASLCTPTELGSQELEEVRREPLSASWAPVRDTITMRFPCRDALRIPVRDASGAHALLARVRTPIGIKNQLVRALPPQLERGRPHAPPARVVFRQMMQRDARLPADPYFHGSAAVTS